MRACAISFSISVSLLVLAFAVPAGANESGQRPIPFTLPAIDGTQVRLEDHLGRGPILITFWASWCGSCKQELHDLLPVYARFEQHGLQVFAINVDKAEAHGDVLGYTRTADLPYTILLDVDSAVIASYQPSLVTPFTVLIDRGGRVMYRHEGHVSGDERTIENLLREDLAGATEKVPAPQTASTDETVSVSGRWEFRADGRKPMLSSVIGGSDEWLVDFRNQLYLDAGFRGFLAHGQLNMRLFHYLDEEPDPRPPDRVALEKFAVEYRGKTLRALAGDFRRAWARGLGLSLKKLDQDGLDTTIRGGDVNITLSTGTRFEVMGGQLNALTYAGTEDRAIAKPDDGLVFGARLEQDLFGYARIGGFALMTHFSPVEPQPGAIPENGKPDRFVIAGGEVELLPTNEWVHAYAAGAFLDRDRTARDEGVPEGLIPDDPKDGYGVFGELNLMFGPVTVLGEIKKYHRFLVVDPRNPEEYAVRLVDPPTLEPPGQEIKQNRDVWGFKAGLRARLAHGLLLTAFMNRTEITEWRDATYDLEPVAYQAWLELDYHGHGGFALRQIRLAGGYRHETMLDTNTGERFVDFMLPSGELEFIVALADDHELRGHTAVKAPVERKSKGLPRFAASEITQELSYTYGGWLSLGAIYGFSDRRRSRDFNHIAGTLALKAEDGWEIRALGGTIFGGKRCVGGVCRLMPDFEGGRLEVVKRF